MVAQCDRGRSGFHTRPYVPRLSCSKCSIWPREAVPTPQDAGLHPRASSSEAEP